MQDKTFYDCSASDAEAPPKMGTYDHDTVVYARGRHSPTWSWCMVTVNKCCPASLIRGVTVNGNTYFAYDICGREVCISNNRGETIEKMNKAVLDGVTF